MIGIVTEFSNKESLSIFETIKYYKLPIVKQAHLV